MCVCICKCHSAKNNAANTSECFFSGMLYFSSQRDAHQRKRHLPSRSSCSCPSAIPPLLSKTSPDSTFHTVRLSENRKMVEIVEIWDNFHLGWCETSAQPSRSLPTLVNCQVNSRSAQGIGPTLPFLPVLLPWNMTFQKVVRVDLYTLDEGSYLQLELQDTLGLL